MSINDKEPLFPLSISDIFVTYFFIVIKGYVNKWNLLLKPKNSLVSARIASISIEGKESVESIYFVETNGDSSSLKFISSRVNLLSEDP